MKLLEPCRLGYKINDIYGARLTKSAEIFECQAVKVYTVLCHACLLVVSRCSHSLLHHCNWHLFYLMNFLAIHYGVKFQMKAK